MTAARLTLLLVVLALVACAHVADPCRDRVQAIKAERARAGVGLGQAKAAVDARCGGPP